jgi:hypothetical protein
MTYQWKTLDQDTYVDLRKLVWQVTWSNFLSEERLDLIHGLSVLNFVELVGKERDLFLFE